MQIYILRHGNSEPQAPGGTDAQRRLTAGGRAQLKASLQRGSAAGAAPSLILSSPYRRAIETAEIAAGVFGYANAIVPTNALIPPAAPQGVWGEIRARQNESALLLVGHEPLLGQLVAYLLNSPTLRVHMRTGTLVHIDMDIFSGEPYGTLEWILAP